MTISWPSPGTPRKYRL